MLSSPRVRNIDARRYEVLEAYEGPFAALKRLQKDIGSTAEIEINRDPAVNDGETIFCVAIPDIAIAFGSIREREVLPGAGITEEKAAVFLLQQFLRVSDIGFSRQRKTSFLAVGKLSEKPQVIVHVMRPQSLPGSNVIPLFEHK